MQVRNRDAHVPVPFLTLSGIRTFRWGEKMSGLTFKNKRRRRNLNFDWILEGLKWFFQIAVVCLLAYVMVWYFGMEVSTVGDSMKPVLENGDVVLVDRLAYKISSPRRGQIVAFYPDGNTNSYCYIRRIIGLPGETVELKEGRIYINQKEIKETYDTTKIDQAGLAKDPVTLGNDEYFVLSDDRSATDDSRGDEIGNVKRTSIEGKVWLTILPGRHFGVVR